jgi:hypothetical protein
MKLNLKNRAKTRLSRKLLRRRKAKRRKRRIRKTKKNRMRNNNQQLSRSPKFHKLWLTHTPRRTKMMMKDSPQWKEVTKSNPLIQRDRVGSQNKNKLWTS